MHRNIDLWSGWRMKRVDKTSTLESNIKKLEAKLADPKDKDDKAWVAKVLERQQKRLGKSEKGRDHKDGERRKRRELTMQEMSAGEVDNLIEEHYGRNPKTAVIMEGQRLMRLQVEPETCDEQDTLVQAFCDNEDLNDRKETLEALLSDLAAQGEISCGEYLIEFND